MIISEWQCIILCIFIIRMKTLHTIIVGGGLAGLTSAIHLSKHGSKVSVFEKNTYPKHKVCGEYISNEVLPYLEYLDIDINTIQPVWISKLSISTQKRDQITHKLPLGGFGISRYTLDHFLYKKALEQGVTFFHEQVLDIKYHENTFYVHTNKGDFEADYVLGAYGKRSILDKTLQRSFSFKKSPWLAVKAHYESDFDPELVALHNFRGGYCGLSMVEDQKINACYLVNYNSFKNYKDITSFQESEISQNPHLDSFFKNANLLFDKPITISQINFSRKKPVENHIFMIGDAAGLIHPLCGNGMAMAIQSSQILCELLLTKTKERTLEERKYIERLYQKKWNSTFSRRLYAGRILQRILLKENLQQYSFKIASKLPKVVPTIIKQTHGKPITIAC